MTTHIITIANVGYLNSLSFLETGRDSQVEADLNTIMCEIKSNQLVSVEQYLTIRFISDFKTQQLYFLGCA